MAGNIKGITIEFRGDTTKLDKALRTVRSEAKEAQTELKSINKQLKFNPKNVELWTQKQKALTRQIADTDARLKELESVQKQLDTANVDKESAEYMELRREIIKTENELKSLNTQLKQIGNVSLRATAEQFKQLGAKMTAAGKAMTRYVTLPLAALGVASLKTTADFDTAMSQVAATMGTTTDQIQELRDFALEMGSTTAFTATEAAEALNYMALAGYDAETSMKMLPVVLNLAAAGSMDLATASDMVTDSQTALGLSVDDTVVLVDQMAKTASTTNTSVSQLGQAYLAVGGNARMLAGGTNELSQVLGLMADNGIKGAEAGVALRNILMALPTEKAQKQLAALGVSAYDANGNLRPLQDTFTDLDAALDGMSDEERTKVLMNIFDKRTIKSANALLGTNRDRWNEVATAIDNADGAAAQMAETQLDNVAGSLTMLKSAAEGAMIAVGDVLAPVFKKLAEWVTVLVDKFNNLSPTVQKIIAVILAVVAAIGPLLLIGGKLAMMIGALMTFGPAIMGVIASVGSALLPIIAIIAVLIGIGVKLYKHLDEIKAKFHELWATIEAVFTAIGNIIISALNTIKSIVLAVWNGIHAIITARINAIKAVIIAAVSVIQSVWDKLSSIPGKVSAIFQRIKSAITTPIQSAKNLIKSAIDKIKSFFPFNLGKILNLKIPHISLSGGKAPWGIAGKGELPKFNVDWYASGGIFNGAQIIGVGEAGAEAVLPLDKLWSQMNAMADSIVNGVVAAGAMGATSAPINITLYAFPGGAEMERWVVNTYEQGKRKFG